MAEALISEVFKRPVLWDHRIKNYHNRDFGGKEWRNLSQTLNISGVPRGGGGFKPPLPEIPKISAESSIS